MLNSFVDLNAGDWIAQNAGNWSVANCVMAIAKSRGYGHSILPTWKNARGRSRSLRSNLREPSARWVFGGARCRACPPSARLIVDALRMMSEAGADSCR